MNGNTTEGRHRGSDYDLFASSMSNIGDVAQFVERRTGTSPTQVRFPGAARDLSPRVNFQYRLSYGVRTLRVQSHAFTSVRTLKIP